MKTMTRQRVISQKRIYVYFLHLYITKGTESSFPNVLQKDMHVSRHKNKEYCIFWKTNTKNFALCTQARPTLMHFL